MDGIRLRSVASLTVSDRSPLSMRSWRFAEVAHHARRQIRQILGQQVAPERGGSSAEDRVRTGW